jgi:hypothetical protein
MDVVNQYIQARNYLMTILPHRIETYLSFKFDSFNKHNVIRDTTKIIKGELADMFPTIPLELLPNCRFRIFEEYMEIEAGVQEYYNEQNGLTYIGTTSFDSETFDLYYRRSYDPQFDYRFIARYGHGSDDFISGSKTAQAEYYLGQQTPLSMAYGIAIEDGYID